MSDSIQIKLKHIAITAEELLAELRGREGRCIAATGDLAEVANILNNRRRTPGTMADREENK